MAEDDEPVVWRVDVVNVAGPVCSVELHGCRSKQTECSCRMTPATPPAVAAVPMPRRLFVLTIGGTHPAVMHAESVLKLQPLHPEPLPLRAWRLLMAFCQADRAFCHLILPHFPDNGGVLMCISRRSVTAVRLAPARFERRAGLR